MNEPMPDVSMTPEPEKKSGGNRPLIIVLIVLLVLCCCCLCIASVVYAWQNGDQWLGALRPLLALL
jgi:hypothetical protein